MGPFAEATSQPASYFVEFKLLLVLLLSVSIFPEYTVAEYFVPSGRDIIEVHATSSPPSALSPMDSSSDGGGRQHVTFLATTPTKMGSPTVS